MNCHKQKRTIDSRESKKKKKLLKKEEEGGREASDYR